MGRPELGTKCVCTGCHERFYDLNRAPAICPRCGAEQPPEKPRGVRPARSTLGTRLLARQPTTAIDIDDEVEPANTSETEDDEVVPEADDETDDDIEIDPGLVKPAD